MNDDDFWQTVLRPTLTKDWDFAYQQAKRMDSSLTTQQIYDMLKQLETNYSRKDTDMSWGTYNNTRNTRNTRGDEVATAVLEAYANGVSFEQLIKKNTQVREYWHQIQHEKAHAEKLREAHQERQRKLAEKKVIEQAKREEAMQKLTPEELEAFGFKARGKRK